MNRNQARKLTAFNAKKAAAKLEVNAYTSRINKAYTKLSMGLSGCSDRTVKALSLPTPRAAKELVEVEHKQHRVVSGVNISAFGRQKIRGKSIPLI